MDEDVQGGVAKSDGYRSGAAKGKAGGWRRGKGVQTGGGPRAPGIIADRGEGLGGVAALGRLKRP